MRKKKVTINQVQTVIGASGKLEKQVLRTEEVSKGTWDYIKKSDRLKNQYELIEPEKPKKSRKRKTVAKKVDVEEQIKNAESTEDQSSEK